MEIKLKISAKDAIKNIDDLFIECNKISQTHLSLPMPTNNQTPLLNWQQILFEVINKTFENTEEILAITKAHHLIVFDIKKMATPDNYDSCLEKTFKNNREIIDQQILAIASIKEKILNSNEEIKKEAGKNFFVDNEFFKDFKQNNKNSAILEFFSKNSAALADADTFLRWCKKRYPKIFETGSKESQKVKWFYNGISNINELYKRCFKNGQNLIVTKNEKHKLNKKLELK